MKKILVGLLLTLAVTAYADRITLIYGDILEGTVLSENEQSVTIRGPFGERTFQRSDIKEIQRGGSPAMAAPQPSANAPLQSQQSIPVVQQPLPEPPKAEPLPESYGSQSGLPAPPAPPPSPYELLKRNAEMQSKWKDLEVAYVQRVFMGGQAMETQYMARIIPPDYLRAKLTTPLPASPQLPQGGEAEIHLSRKQTTLWQVTNVPGRPTEYIKLDMARVEGLIPGDNPVEAFQQGIVGAAGDEELLNLIATNSAIVASENTNGHECWVLETIYTPPLIETQVNRHPPETRDSLRQQLSQVGKVKIWIGKEDLIQWRLENYGVDGALMMSLQVLEMKPNQGLTPEQLRMKVPPGTEFLDVTDLVSSQLAQYLSAPPGMAPLQLPNQAPPDGGMGMLPQQPQSMPGQPPMGMMPQQPLQQPMPQGVPPMMGQQPGWSPPPQGVPQQNFQQPMMPPPLQGQMMMPPQQQQPMYPYQMPQSSGAPQGYPMAPVPQGQMMPGQQPQGFTQTFIQQGQPMPQQQSSGGGFFSRLFGRGQQQQQPVPMFMGPNQTGNQTMMVPVINGQPQFPSPPR